MQDETQTRGGDAAAPEPNDATDPVAASSEELGQDAPAADPWAGATLPETAEQAGGGEVADAPAADPWGGTPPPGPVEQEGPPLEDELEPDEPSASERVEPPGSDAAPIVEGEASPLIGGGGALPTEELRDEAFSGEEEGEGPPDAATAAEATAPTDAAAGGAAVGAVGEAGGPGEAIEDAADEAILDPPEATEDAFISKEQWDHIREHIPPGTTGGAPSEPGGEVVDAPAAEWNPWDKAAGGVADAAEAAVIEKGEAVEESIEVTGEALEDVAESIPFVGDTLGDAVGDATDVAQDFVDDVF